MIRLILFLAMLITATAPARADDISAAARGVVRVVTIASAEGEVVGFGHGSGFAVSPNRIVTNAHVVELAARYPDNVVIGVVPSEGDKSYQGKLIAYDAQRDLALIEFTGTRLPPLTFYPGAATDGEAVIALGYPGNVDVATAQSAADFIKPLGPVRSQGGFSGTRKLTGVDVLLHTAGIARGNSGGPLLDICGRVIGANSAITKAEEGDSSFGFAVANSEIAAFLKEAKQSFAQTSAPCISAEERLRQGQDAQVRSAEARAADAQAAAMREALQREVALDKARIEAERRRENVIAIAGLLLVIGALGIGGAGILESRRRRQGAIWTGAAGVLLIIAAAVVFLTRPYGDVTLAVPPPDTAPSATVQASFGKMLCRIAPDRSRINLSNPADVTIDWQPDGCMNGRTQYAENGAKWERILVPNDEQTVSVLEYDLATRSYSESRYLLSAAQMKKARSLRGAVKQKACTTSEAERQLLSRQQTAIRAALPARPDEWLVYDCAPAPADTPKGAAPSAAS
ncbi:MULTISPECIES: S1C family serine protease [unclassified Sphingomonas]|uniref:S1C family serine protease n=1 Tax=unclassified Sphingomonas TaxID=196159 RepID=UPI000BD3B494|nr:MAG: trypsin [Sphingomonas sp. 12-62-6]OYX37421.1 MAG: trypsin [Sphingomonas sp. 32-62-10]OYY65390.1 MAG: trypsin [Sphingomonas sp. 28-62-11]